MSTAGVKALGVVLWGLESVLYTRTERGRVVFGHDGVNDPAHELHTTEVDDHMNQSGVGSISRTRQVGTVLLAFLIGSTCSASVLVFLIPAGYAHVSAWSRFVQLVVLSLIGPLLAGAVPGPDGLGVLELVIRIGVPLLVLGILVQGYFRRRSLRALLIAAAIWSVVGGFAAFVAATGSI